MTLSRPTEYFRVLRLHYNGRQSTSAFRDCTTTADRVLPRSEIVLLRPTEYFRIPRLYYLLRSGTFPFLRLYYFGRQSTSAFQDCTTSADRVLPRSEIVLQRPTEYFRISRLYYLGRQSTSAFGIAETSSNSAAKLLTLRNISKSKGLFLFIEEKFAGFSLNYRH
jgi:hypothetical protein